MANKPPDSTNAKSGELEGGVPHWPQMRTLFPGCFRLSDAEIRTLWESATFVFDANVLLNIYRYSPQAKTALKRVLAAFGPRIWVPFQAAEEFQRNRSKVITSQISAYESALGGAESLLASLLAPRSHPFVSDAVLATTKSALNSLERELRQRLDAHEKLLHNDPDLHELSELLEGRVGEEPSAEDRKKQLDQARARFEQRIPPGYKDKKPDDRELGDAIVWLQTLQHARAKSIAMVMITDDGKEDWWEVVRGRTLGPRPELVKEFMLQAKQLFHMYQPSQFIKYAAQFFKLDVDAEVIKEVKSVTVERAVVEQMGDSTSGPASGELSSQNLLEYLRAFRGRIRATKKETAQLARELRSHGYETIEEVQQLVTDEWDDFEEFERNRVKTGLGKFHQVGVVRVIMNRTVARSE